MASSNDSAIRTALESAIASERAVTLVVRLDSGKTREVVGVVTGIYKGQDGRDRVTVLIGTQTQQAVLFDSITNISNA